MNNKRKSPSRKKFKRAERHGYFTEGLMRKEKALEDFKEGRILSHRKIMNLLKDK